MTQILLVGHGLNDTLDLKKWLKSSYPKHEIIQVPPDRQEIKKHLGKETCLTILNDTTPLDTRKLHLQAVRELGYGEVILVLSKVEARNEVSEIQKLPNVLLLEKPYTEDDFLGLTEKILTQSPVNQRLHQRFRFNEVVGIEGFGISGQIAAEIKKISKGGALLQLKGHSSLEMGDIIQVNIELREVGRFHRIPARVVNSESGQLIGPSDHFGVAWLSSFVRPTLSSAS